MEIEHLRQFIILAKRLNFTSTAERLYITQSTLSRHMTAIEDELEIKLFNRTTQSVELTDAGRFFWQRIDELLNDYDDICSRLRIMKNGYNSRLQIGVPYYAMKDYLREIPEQFEISYPDIKLQYSVGDPNEIIKLFNRGKIDLAILPRYPVFDTDNTVIIPLFRERLGVLLPSHDSLAQKKSLKITDLVDKTFFSVENSYFFSSWHHTVSICKTAGFSPRGPVNFNQMESLLMAIRRGDGITIVGAHMRSQKSDFIKFRYLDNAEGEREICIIYDKRNENTSIRKFSKLYLDNLNKGLDN